MKKAISQFTYPCNAMLNKTSFRVKWISVMLIVSMVFSISGCNAEPDATSNHGTTITSTCETTNPNATIPTENAAQPTEATALPSEPTQNTPEVTFPIEEVIPSETAPTEPATTEVTCPEPTLSEPVPDEPVPSEPTFDEPLATEPVTEPLCPTEPKPAEPTVPTEPAFEYEEVNEMVYATDAVNVRLGPGTAYEKIGSLDRGDAVLRIGICENGWSKVIYNGTNAFVFSEYLTTTEVVDLEYPLVYTDETCTITIYKEWFENAWVYAAHIQFTDYSRLSTACANGAYKNGYETTSHAAERLGAILAINGCYSAPNLNYIVVRDGEICNGADRSMCVPAVYSSYNGLLLSAWETGGDPRVKGKVTDLVAQGLVTDTFCFGPPGLQNGVVTDTNTKGSRAQRTFIGTNGNAGDIWLCVSDGRYNDGESAGLTGNQCMRYLVSKGCTFGVNLDGGGSTTMYFNGQVLNAAAGNERKVVDFLCFK